MMRGAAGLLVAFVAGILVTLVAAEVGLVAARAELARLEAHLVQLEHGICGEPSYPPIRIDERHLWRLEQ